MHLENINKNFKSRGTKPEGMYSSYAILIPIVFVDNELHLLFEVRSEELNTQPGEICFPGGRIEKNEYPVEASIRETCEELRIDDSSIEIIGGTDYIVTPFNTILYPFVGVLNNIKVKNIDYNRDEVGSVFTVPLNFFIKNHPETHFVETKLDIPDNFPFHKIENGKVYNFRTGKYPIYFYEYNGYIIWGITARIIQNFINILTQGS